MSSKKNYFITGTAGFIGFHLARRLLSEGHSVIGLDNLNPYYSVELKRKRNLMLKEFPQYHFFENDLSERKVLEKIIDTPQLDTVFHLAAQAGVRYSLENPESYLKSNIDGTFNLLETVRHAKVRPNLLIASSSSVYGLSKQYPFSENDRADQPVALYGATKRSTELISHSYCHIFGMRATLLRFFSVYGPWGRPDVALWIFAERILKGEEIEVYNGGDMIRDFTYVDDIVEGIIKLAEKRKNPELPAYDVFNIGCSKPRTLMDFIGLIEKALNKKAKIKFLPFQPGDIYKSYADVSKLKALTGYSPQVSIDEGVPLFVNWYLENLNATCT